MPIYNYECPKCHKVKERLASLEEFEIQRCVPCEECHLLMHPVPQVLAIIGKQTSTYNPNHGYQENDPNYGDRNAYESLRLLEKNGKLTKKVFDAMDGKKLLKRKSELAPITPVSKLGG
jgi:predicted nucleic acid-binding Zn ribbon protein